jgi:hypothetical protein
VGRSTLLDARGPVPLREVLEASARPTQAPRRLPVLPHPPITRCMCG